MTILSQCYEQVTYFKIFRFCLRDKGKVTLTDRFVVIGFYSTETAVEFQSFDPSELDCHCSLTLFHFKRLLSFQISPATLRALAFGIDRVVFAVSRHP